MSQQKMLAAVFLAPGELKVGMVKIPAISSPDEVLIKVEMASICGTDVHILSIPPGHPANFKTILGHEYVGRVMEVGSNVKEFQVNDLVAVDPNITCGACRYCLMGKPNMCERMTTLGIFINGGFAEYNVAPAKNLYKVKGVDAEQAVFAESLSCVLNGFKKLNFLPGENAVVLGAGPMGLYFTMLFKNAGANSIIVSETNELRGELAMKIGASFWVNPEKENLADIVKEATAIGADVVVDAVGSLFSETLKLVRRGGRILLYGMNDKAQSVIYQNYITRYELQIFGSYIAPFTFPSAIKIIESEILPLERLISHELPLKDINKGIDMMRRGEGLKILIKL